jgi:ribosomal-protein-alanine N-acetyltransferase
MDIVFETDRLALRLFTEDDASLLYELNLDPEVTRYTHDPMTDLAHAKKVLEEVILPQYTLYNHGRWAVLLKSNLEFIGWSGLKCRPEPMPTGRQGNEIDLGYRFMKKFWGQGYATEAAFACLHYGFETLYLKEIIGRALPGNLASIKVLEKCGMHYLGEEYVDGYLHKTYQATNPAIQQ